MSLLMEDFKPSVSTLEEVKKLQDLVRKLEIQNLHLRNKQNAATRKRSISPTKEVKSPTKVVGRSSKKEVDGKLGATETLGQSLKHSIKDEYFDDLEIIKVSDMEMSDDESWLYTSPKGMPLDQRNESPYKWLRKDVDDPENKELQLTKKALLTKLNELEILSTSNHVSTHIVENPVVSSLRRPQVPYKMPTVHSNDHGQVDTRTFTRSKKKQALEFLETLEVLENEKNFDRNCSVVELHRRGSDLSLDSISSGHVLEDANDVQEVARLQEESLRLSSPIGTPKRASLNSVSSRKMSASSRSSVSDLDTSENQVFNSQTSENVSNKPCTSTPSYQMDNSNHSDQSSPSGSPYGSNVSLNNSGKSKVIKLSGYRRSLPNLNRDPAGVRQSKNKSPGGVKPQKPSSARGVPAGRKSDTSLQTVQKARREVMSPTRQRLRQPSSQLSSSGSSHLESPQSSAPSPIVPQNAENESRLRPRSGLPKPTRASSATRSRSGIPVPSMLSRRQEDSWSEGCF